MVIDAAALGVIVLSLVISIIGFFLKRSVSDLDVLKEKFNIYSTKLQVIENDYLNKNTHLEAKIDSLSLLLKDLSLEIKNLTHKMATTNKSNNEV